MNFLKKKTSVKSEKNTPKNTPKDKKKKHSKKSNEIPKEKSNPLENLGAFWKRIVGDFPLFEDVPVTEKDLKKLFSTKKAFVDYLPFMEYDAESQLFIMDDGISCGAVFKITPIDVDGRSEATLQNTTDDINTALMAAPIDQENPYTIQVFIEDKQPENLADLYRKNIPKEIQETELTQAFLEVMDEHSSLMNNSSGLFPDDRILDSESPKGWRAIDRQITLVIYRKAPASVWEKESEGYKNNLALFNEKISGFLAQLSGGAGIQTKKMNENDFFQWLAPIFNPTPVGYVGSAVDWAKKNHIDIPEEQKGAAWDLAQIICPEPPKVIGTRDANRGIMKFGDKLSQFITLQPIFSAPDSGVYTTDTRKDKNVIASPWDRLPAESMMVFTITPLPTHTVENQLATLIQVAEKGSGHEADNALHQAREAQRFLASGNQRIFNFHAGIYIRADSVQELDKRYNAALAIMNNSRTMNAISEENDLIATDSYIRNLPFVYNYKFDQKHSKRAFKTYTSHIASVLPFYGRPTTEGHFCYLNYNRSGELIAVDPFDGDRQRVGHSGMIGPTGAGKSATQAGQAVQSMATKRPRQFFIDKGGSFKLTAAYYEAHGVKVRRITFHANSNETLAPYAETYNAIKFLEDLKKQQEEAKKLEDLISSGKYIPPSKEEDLSSGNVFDSEDDTEDDERDYLGEMMNSTLLMITGGKQAELEKLQQYHRSFIQEALIGALYYAKENKLPHALPQHVADQLHIIAQRERDQDIEMFRTLYQLAKSMETWTKGTEGKFFNQYSEPFDDSVDATFLELGVIANEGNEAMLAVAISTLISNITEIGEKNQNTGRHIDVFLDECHYVTANELLVHSVVVGVKVWRKISIWLHLATQNITDFPDHAAKILALLEWWWLLAMQPDDVEKLCDLKNFDDNTRFIMSQCKAAPPNYVEAVMVSDKYNSMLLRLIPPSLYLVLGKTDGKEKRKLMDLAKEHGITHLEAAMLDAKNTTQKRRERAAKLTQNLDQE